MRKICWATFRLTVYLAAESWPNDTKSMLNSTAHFSALNLSSVGRVDLTIAGCNRFSPVCSVRATATDRSLTSRGPRHCHLQAASRLQHRTFCASTAAAHGRAHVGSLMSSPLRRQIRVSSMQTQQTAAAQQEEVKTLRAHQQGAGAAETILPEAKVALHPFLTRASEQPAREQVDYSRGQRPLQVRFSTVFLYPSYSGMHILPARGCECSAELSKVTGNHSKAPLLDCGMSTFEPNLYPWLVPSSNL